LKTDNTYRLGMVSVGQIKRMPGIKADASKKSVSKARDFADRRGYYMPVILSDADDCMTLLAGDAVFKACIEEKRAKIPAVIVQTKGGADDLMFALQSVEFGETPDAISVSAAIVQLIDSYGVSRKSIAESLGKSPAWCSRMEGLSRKLNATVQKLVAEGHISARSAQDIARLPSDAQTSFAISVGNEFLSKEKVTYLVNRYLNEDTGAEERDRIVRTPVLALPNEQRSSCGRIRDCSDSARLSRAMARCLDDAAFLINLLNRVDISGIAVRAFDAVTLADSLSALILRLQAIFYPGKNAGIGGSTDD